MQSDPLRHSQLKTIVTLFVIMRLTILVLYTPQGLLNAYTDYSYYYRTAQLSDQGYYPFVNMWYEHLPPMAYTSELAYRAVQLFVPMGGLDSVGYQLFARLLGSIMLIFEAGVLILINRIATQTWGADKADWLSWVYSALSLPIFFGSVSQTSSIAFFTLLAIYWFINEHQTQSALALGLAIVSKLTPIFLLAPIVKFLFPHWRRAAAYTLIALLTIIAIFVPFVLAGGGVWIVASVKAIFTRASWSTPWSIIDGNWSVGNVGDLPTRLQLDQATVIHGNPSAIPAIVTIGVFAIVYWLIFRRPIESRGPREFVRFSTITLVIFLLWSKGWSPHWATLITPLLLLSFPDRRGLWLTLLLTGIVFIEWPLSDAFGSHALLAISIACRTLLFITIAVLCARQLYHSPAADQATPSNPL